MTDKEFEMLKLRVQYYEPIEVADAKGTRQGQFLVMHDKQRNTFGFLPAGAKQAEILSIAETEIRPL